MATSKTLELSIKIAGRMDKSLTAAINGTQSKIGSLTKSISNIGTVGLATMGAVATAAAVGIAGCTKEAQALESAMAPVVRYVDGLADASGAVSDAIADNGKTFKQNYGALKTYIQDLSTDIPRTTDQLTAMSAALGQSGIGVDKQLTTGYLRDTAVAATAMDLDDQTAGNYVAKWEASFNFDHKQVMELMDQINYLGAHNATTAGEIAQSVNSAASMGQIAGVDPAATAAMATAMQATGVATDRVGTSIKGQAELLKTSTGEALDALVALLGLTRQESKKATAKERFMLAEARADTVAVPAGTRVKTQGGRYFNTLDYAEIPPGATYVDTIVQAEEAGAESSGILAGEINILVDPIPYIASVSNVDESTGGLDVEDDDSLTERAYLAPSRFSCAGPRDAYEYHVREWRSDVTDVQITSPEPCVIAIYFVMEGGRLPNATEREELAEYISGENLRPLCDKVVCVEPEEVPYNIAFTYWISDGDQRSAGTIQEKVTAAVQSYQSWQRHLGRDINPTELIAKIREAGAKRVKLTAPADIVIGKTQLPKCTGQTVTYGGLEDD